MDISVRVALPPDLTDDEVNYVAARLQDTLNNQDLKALACQFADDLVLHGNGNAQPIGILAQADGANA